MKSFEIIEKFIDTCITEGRRTIEKGNVNPDELTFSIKMPRQSGHTTAMRNKTIEHNERGSHMLSLAINDRASAMHRKDYNFFSQSVSSIESPISLIKRGAFMCFEIVIIDDYSRLRSYKNLLKKLRDVNPTCIVIGLG